MLEGMLRSFVKTGKLTIIRPDGSGFAVRSVANASEPDIMLRLKKRSTEFKIAINPDLYFGEAYMDGTVESEQGRLAGLRDVGGRNLEPARHPSSPSGGVGGILRAGQQPTRGRPPRRSAAH